MCVTRRRSGRRTRWQRCIRRSRTLSSSARALCLAREVIRQFVDERYPGICQPSTLTAHLYACAINNPKAYIHHPHADRFLYKNAAGTFELYEEGSHGRTLGRRTKPRTLSKEAAQAIEASISLERDIKDQLAQQLDSLEPALKFVARQVTIAVGRVDSYFSGVIATGG